MNLINYLDTMMIVTEGENLKKIKRNRENKKRLKINTTGLDVKLKEFLSSKGYNIRSCSKPKIKRTNKGERFDRYDAVCTVTYIGTGEDVNKIARDTEKFISRWTKLDPSRRIDWEVGYMPEVDKYKMKGSPIPRKLTVVVPILLGDEFN